LIVSGGHSNFFFILKPDNTKWWHVPETMRREGIRQGSQNDGLGYPGGPISSDSRAKETKAVRFAIPEGDGLPDFSFSGLRCCYEVCARKRTKTLENGDEPSQEIKDLAASFQDWW